MENLLKDFLIETFPKKFQNSITEHFTARQPGICKFSKLSYFGKNQKLQFIKKLSSLYAYKFLI